MKSKNPKSRSKMKSISPKGGGGAKSKKKANAPKEGKVVKRRGGAAAENVPHQAKVQVGPNPVISPTDPPSAAVPGASFLSTFLQEYQHPLNEHGKTVEKTWKTYSIDEEIQAASDLMKSAQSWFKSSEIAGQENADELKGKAAERGEIAWKTCQSLNDLLERTLTVLLRIPDDLVPYARDGFLRRLIDTLVHALTSIKSLTRDKQYEGIFTKIAEQRAEFPSLVTVLKKQNADAEKFILEKLNLGGTVPGCKLSPEQYSPFNNLAKRIMSWILTQQLDGDSIYWTVAPTLKESGTADQEEWYKIVAFHLDCFQSPSPKHWRKWDSQYVLSTYPYHEVNESGDLEERHSVWLARYGKMPFEVVNEDPEFQECLKKENLKSPAQFYNRVKHKVLAATRALTKDGYPNSLLENFKRY